MKYPMFAFVVGGLLVETINLIAASPAHPDGAMFCGFGAAVLTVVAGLFEANG